MSSPIKSDEEDSLQNDDKQSFSELSSFVDGYQFNTLIKNQYLNENASTDPNSLGQNYASAGQNQINEKDIYQVMNDKISSNDEDSDNETPKTEIRKEPEKEFKTEKIKKKIFMITKKRKRKRKHTKKDCDNGTARIVSKVIKNLTRFIQLKINNIRKIKKTKYESELIVPSMTPYLRESKIKKSKFLRQKIEDYYKDTTCPRLNEKRPDVSNEKIIDDILDLKENDIQKDVKRLDILFNAEFTIFLDCFLNDKRNITIENEFFELNDFITFKDCFNEGNDVYNAEEKEKLKNYITEFMNLKVDE